jgi:hypothetical protein
MKKIVVIVCLEVALGVLYFNTRMRYKNEVVAIETFAGEDVSPDQVQIPGQQLIDARKKQLKGQSAILGACLIGVSLILAFSIFKEVQWAMAASKVD